MNKIVFWILIGILCIYVLIIGYVFFNQHNIVLSPSSDYHPPPKSFNIIQDFIQFGDDDSLHTWYVKNNKNNLTVLYFSGNAFNISHRLFHVDVFNKLKINAFMFDYKGYGLSTDLIKNKESFFESSVLAYDYMIDELGIDSDSIIFWGYSLGSPIASELASRNNSLGIILESPVISINKISEERFPYIPFSVINKFNFDINQHINQSKSSVLIIHSKDDDVIPFRHVSVFFDNIERNNKKLIEINGTHRLSSSESFPVYFENIQSYISDLTKKVN
tara:strand:+ start:16626 stop:17453 length:828 start_codon:yes stop_codon:yes gene_type:complete